MTVFRFSENSCDALDPRECALSVARFLYPLGAVLESHGDDDFFYLILREKRSLIRLEAHSREVRDREVERLIRNLAALEAKRKEFRFAKLDELVMCLAAPAYEDAFARRVQTYVPRLFLYEYSLISSGARDALLVDEFHPCSNPQPTEPSSSEARVPFQTGDPIPRQELTALEVIALARFGKELRERHTNVSTTH